MKTNIIIQSYIPHQQTIIAQEINTPHKKVLDFHHFDVSSNNSDWTNKENIIGF